MAEKSMNLTDLIGTLEEWFSKLPALPVSAKDVIVKIAPWLALIFGILGVLAGLGGVAALLGLGALGMAVVPLGGYGAGTAYMAATATGVVFMLIALASSVLELLSFPGLKARKMAGWNYAFYSVAVGVIGAIVAFSFFNAVVEAVVGFYLLFQVKSYYAK
ncbi:hypothetical protein HY440_01790 [Candidatus Microgenomates bacterium]|nr:hypothetical protein [Candidatus Microgenomates bacterium]